MVDILFHGASVTQQGGDGSYFLQLQNKLSGFPNISIQRKSYGGCHLNDAGFITIDDDTQNHCDICVLEWNSTSQSEFEMDKLGYIAGTLLDKSIVPVFLILGRLDTLEVDRHSEIQVIEFCRENKIPCLDYRNLIDKAVDLRDVVHTTPSGADKYAERLLDDLTHIISVMNDFKARSIQYKKFKLHSLLNLDLQIEEGESIAVEVADVTDGSQLILDIIRGPSSPIINVERGVGRLSIWDKWSLFERNSFIIVSNNIISKNNGSACIDIDVLPDAVDYSICNKGFEYIGTKVLKIHGIYGVDCQPVSFSLETI